MQLNIVAHDLPPKVHVFFEHIITAVQGGTCVSLLASGLKLNIIM